MALTPSEGAPCEQTRTTRREPVRHPTILERGGPSPWMNPYSTTCISPSFASSCRLSALLFTPLSLSCRSCSLQKQACCPLLPRPTDPLDERINASRAGVVVVHAMQRRSNPTWALFVCLSMGGARYLFACMAKMGRGRAETRTRLLCQPPSPMLRSTMVNSRHLQCFGWVWPFWSAELRPCSRWMMRGTSCLPRTAQ